MGVFKISMVLWVTFVILAKSSEFEENIKEQVSENLQEKSMVTNNTFDENDDNEEDGWGLEDEVEDIPSCVPNFFKPVSEPCVCVGSGKTIEGSEVGNLYCFPQPNRFQVKIKDNEYQKISIPTEYEHNMVPNKELKSCTPDEQLDVNEVCFCGTENDKENLKNTWLSSFVPLKHICVPLDENEETNRILPYHKLRYCYQNQCQRNSADYKDNLSMQKPVDLNSVLCQNWNERLNDAVELQNVENVFEILHEDESQYIIEWLMKENNTALHIALKKGNEEIVQILLNAFIEDKNENLIEYLMKKNQEKETTLHLASKNGNVKNVELLFNVFGKREIDKELTKNLMKQNKFNEDTIERLNIKFLLDSYKNKLNNKLIEYVMQENNSKDTALHLVSRQNNKEIVQLILNIFGEEEKESLIKCVMKGNIHEDTALHIALQAENDEIAKLLLNLNVFSKYQNTKLVEYMLKENNTNLSVLGIVNHNLAFHTARKEKYELDGYGYHFAHELESLATKIESCEQMRIFLDHKLKNAKNAKTLNDLQQVIESFKDQISSPIVCILDRACLAGPRNAILQFLIFDYDPDMHFLQEEKNTKQNIVQ